MVKKILTLFSVLICLAISPFATANASSLNSEKPTANSVTPAASCYDSYDFDFEFFTKLTGITRALCAGTLNVSGEIYATGYESEDKTTVLVEIKKDVLGTDPVIDSFTVDVADGETTYFDEDLVDIPAGNYYIVMKKKSGSYWYFEGSGTISTY
ncbi:hypothetical protein [Bacillus sp. AF23]|uniref:hypothetical protein n=1 Tax=Bacillus sp. AF23 TaxID=2821151 RepID=UPI001E5D27DF|nr:hypothetical protein [Bacillus sp. AF23]MCC8351944.1 hypothetical protein [Bacillus sp. AF23]